MSFADQVRKDLAAFVDPATELRITQGTSGIRVELIRNGIEHDYYLDLKDQTLSARHLRGRKYQNLRSLIASSDFADIRAFAATQTRLHKDFNSDRLIPPEGNINGGKLTKNSLLEALSPLRFSSSTDNSKIGIVLLDGPAGVGKTSLVNSHLVNRARHQADAGALPPILHVTSRGRRLSGLNDALAQSIDILRAKFTFDQTPALIRHRLLQIAIDGFDELVDPDGYRDAWYALKDFFEEVGVGGPIILAGRDTFFDQQKFRKQLESSQYSFDLSHVRLNPSSPSTAKNWLKQQGWSESDLNDDYTNLVLRPGSYTLRPYFLSQLAAAKSWSALETSDLTPRAFLVEKFLAREADLLSEKLPISSIELKSCLASLFEEIAMEMADTETDAIDLGFLQLATEVAFGGVLEGQELAKLQHKAGSFALLETDVREGYRRFPHTEVSHHFLASALIISIVSGTRVRFLHRGTLASDLLAIFAEQFTSQSEHVAKQFVDQLERAMNDEMSFDRFPENAAALLITSLCHQYSGIRRRYDELLVLDAVLFDVVSPAALHRVKFQRLDVREGDLSKIEFVDCQVMDLTVDATTKFGATLPSVHRLLLVDEKGVVHEIFEPDEIARWLREHSTSNVVEHLNADAIDLLERVCRKMIRQHMIKDHEDDDAGRLLRHNLWEPIEQILSENKIVERMIKPTAGTSASLVRMQDPFKLLVQRSTNQRIKAIWDKVGKIPLA
jgi:hypothetical protein